MTQEKREWDKKKLDTNSFIVPPSGKGHSPTSL